MRACVGRCQQLPWIGCRRRIVRYCWQPRVRVATSWSLAIVAILALASAKQLAASLCTRRDPWPKLRTWADRGYDLRQFTAVACVAWIGSSRAIQKRLSCGNEG